MRAISQAPDAGMKVEGLEKVRISAELDGTNLDSLTWDATNVTLRFTQGTAAPHTQVPASAPRPEVVHSRSGIARSLRFTARPLRIQRTKVAFDAQLFDVPIAWVVYDTPSVPGIPASIRGVEPGSEATGVRGTLDMSLRTADLAPLMRSLLEPALRGTGFHLGRLDLDVEQDGIDGIHARGRARIRWKLISASVKGDARLHISDDGVITVNELRVSSRNPLIAIGLRIARSHVRAQVGRSFDLNQEFSLSAPAPRLHHVRVSAGQELRISARLGQA
jgi:hypothetical protein